MKPTGNHSTLLKSTSLRVCIMEMPMTIRAGAVAAVGTIRNRGANSMLRKKQQAVTTAVRPVRPPASTPEADST